ncbi:MAG: polysaccharide biosynthesis C-terminal domain-containing protein [Muribaculaceae bacterium]
MSERDSIDFGKTDISKLFVKIFLPTLASLMFGASVYVADGIFVGNGVGSLALAAVNIASPMFLIATGLAIMFGSGVSIVAAIHLSRGNHKAANINVTQAVIVSIAIIIVLCSLVWAFPVKTAELFGSEGSLTPIVTEYLKYVLPSFFGSMLLVVGMFVIRLDGAPKFSMWANVIASIANIVLDYLFVFPFEMGIKGAAIATSISQCGGAVLVMIYMVWFPKTLHLYKIKLSKTSLRLTTRNIIYMIKLGIATFIGETAMACLMVVGNIEFMHYLHESGVAAFSVACYILPLVFMFGNAVAQSALPIISYNYGASNEKRVSKTFRLSMRIAAAFGVLLSLLGMSATPTIASIFISSDDPAFAIATSGLPFYSVCFMFLVMNVVLIGYLQSLERYNPANIFMLLRGYILIIPAFIGLPAVIGTTGLWCAPAVSEGLTFAIIVTYLILSKKKTKTIK